MWPVGRQREVARGLDVPRGDQSNFGFDHFPEQRGGILKYPLVNCPITMENHHF